MKNVISSLFILVFAIAIQAESLPSIEIKRTSVSITENQYEYNVKATFSEKSLTANIENHLIQSLGEAFSSRRGKSTWMVEDHYAITLKEGKFSATLDKEALSADKYNEILEIVTISLSFLESTDTPSVPTPPRSN